MVQQVQKNNNREEERERQRKKIIITEKKELNDRIKRKKSKMLVPDNQQRHVISMYLATCGANGHLLGSDEKEIIYLVFGIIDLQNKEVSDQKYK